MFRAAHDTDCAVDALLVKYWRDRKLYEYGLRRACGILTQSRGQQRALLDNYGLHSRVAGMLVEPPEGGREYEGERDVDALWVNNLRGFKRPDLCVALAERLPRFRFHMIGAAHPGEAALQRRIEQQAAAAPNLVFHGHVPYHEVGPRYGRAKILINTSDSEGFPNSYLQAWVRGTPVVAFFDPDSVIRREGLGLVATSLDDMAAAVAHLLEDRGAWAEASARCKAYMARVHGEERILAPYLEVFHQASSWKTDAYTCCSS